MGSSSVSRRSLVRRRMLFALCQSRCESTQAAHTQRLARDQAPSEVEGHDGGSHSTPAAARAHAHNRSDAESEQEHELDGLKYRHGRHRRCL